MAAQSNPSQIQPLMTALANAYGHAECALVHQNVYELVVATILSAQCTDKRVNIVTPALFERYPTPEKLAAARLDDVEKLIKSTGFYRNKAKAIVGMAQRVSQEHAGVVPKDIDSLLALPGVARKTANVVLGVGYGISVGIVVDTHVGRLSRRLGLTKNEEPKKVEQDLMKVVPRDRWIDFSHMLIEHGRQVCAARAPRCDLCRLTEWCPSAFKFPQFGEPKPKAASKKTKKQPKRASTQRALKKTASKKKAKRKVAIRRA